MKIGIDFDNTIARYDQSFLKLGIKNRIIKKGELIRSKSEIKKVVLKKRNGKKLWMKMQGLAYGRYMSLAEIFPNIANFLILSKIRNFKIFIVSHKTEYGHFDKKKISLRKEAIKWMKNNEFFKKNLINFDKKNIYFANSRNEKIKIIKKLKCDYFIDDLIEVLEDKNFPNKTKKILFGNYGKKFDNKIFNFNNWNEIINHLFGKLNNNDVSYFLNLFSKKKYKIILQVYGKGNSVIYKAKDNNNKKYAIKFYPDKLNDSRPRLKNEFNILHQLNKVKVNIVPKPISKSNKFNIGIYSWIDGKPILIPKKNEINDLINFVKKLKKMSKQKSIKADLASEACLSGKDLIDQIDLRLNKIKLLKNKKLDNFLKNTYIPLWHNLTKNYFNQWPKSSKNKVLDKKNLILSPSDFGMHNVLKKNKRLYFLDFEYFGWDDPVKLCADFLWHPSNKLNQDLKKLWVNSMIMLFSEDKDFQKRFNVSLPFYGMRWVMIILNEFFPEYATRRKLAGNMNTRVEKMTKNIQLTKAIKYCKEIEKLIDFKLKNKFI